MSEDKNKKICGILGICWHEITENESVWLPASCKYIHRCAKCGERFKANPDFYTDAGAVRLLRELEKQEWYLSFMGFAADNLLNEEYFELITTPGLLADKLIEWKEGKV